MSNKWEFINPSPPRVLGTRLIRVPVSNKKQQRNKCYLPPVSERVTSGGVIWNVFVMCLMKPAHPSVMTPQPLSCVMHHILLPSSSEHGCHHVSSRAPSGSIASAEGYTANGRGGGSGVIRCLFNFSNSRGCHPHPQPPPSPPLARLIH